MATPTLSPADIARFWAKVDKDGPLLPHVAHLGPCWMWCGNRNRRGYGRMSVRGSQEVVGAVSLLIVGVDRGVNLVCHHCDNPSCVNPDHLFLGSSSQNMQDCVRKGRHKLASKTHCLNGHPFSGENLYITHRGHRACRLCMRVLRRNWKRKHGK
jgi:Fe-S-cluster-containing dehydrogenase component